MLDKTPETQVLFFIDGLSTPYAGTEGQLIRLIQGLIDVGDRPQLLSLNASEYLQSGALCCPVTTVGHSRLASPRLWWHLLKLALGYRRAGLRVVHCFFNDTALLGPVIFRLAGFRVITSRRDMGIWYSPAKLRWLRFNRWLTAACVANSAAVKAQVALSEGLPKERIHVVYNGFENPPAALSRRPQRPFPEDTVVLGMVANLRPVKRITDAIRALSIAIQAHDNLRLVLVGNHDPRDPSDFLALTESLGLQEYVYFAGRQDNPLQWMEGFDIALLCSESEGFSNAIIEYQQVGLPVICSRVGGNPEIIEQGVNGYLYEKGAVESLATRICQLAGNPALRESMGQAGRKKVRERFSLGGMVQAHRTLYQSLIKQHSGVRHWNASRGE